MTGTERKLSRDLAVGKWFRLCFPSTYAKVVAYRPKASLDYPYLVESWIIKARWWCDEQGRPNNHRSPRLKP